MLWQLFPGQSKQELTNQFPVKHKHTLPSSAGFTLDCCHGSANLPKSIRQGRCLTKILSGTMIHFALKSRDVCVWRADSNTLSTPPREPGIWKFNTMSSSAIKEDYSRVWSPISVIATVSTRLQLNAHNPGANTIQVFSCTVALWSVLKLKGDILGCTLRISLADMKCLCCKKRKRRLLFARRRPRAPCVPFSLLLHTRCAQKTLRQKSTLCMERNLSWYSCLLHLCLTISFVLELLMNFCMWTICKNWLFICLKKKKTDEKVPTRHTYIQIIRSAHKSWYFIQFSSKLLTFAALLIYINVLYDILFDLNPIKSWIILPASQAYLL